jgi:hypothetical protein
MRKLVIAVISSVLLFTTAKAKTKTITLTITQPNSENCITAINNQIKDCLFSIFPNPGNGFFTVEINNSSAEKEAILLVHDVVGKVIINEKINISGYSVKTIDLSNYPIGTYILNIISEKKETYSADLIIF